MIPINRPWLEDEEINEVMSVLRENALTSAAYGGGKRVKELENSLQQYLNVKHIIAVNSGTAAIQAALLAAGIGPGDEVLIPSFTFVATANAVVATGATPVFVDINNRDFTIDVSDLKSKISPTSKAIVPVHLYGHPCEMDEILEAARSHSLAVIEDACQSLGSTYKKKQTGTFGLMGCFSFYASKVLTAGEGGAVVTDSDEMAHKLRMIRNHGMVEGYDTRILGLNLRLPEINAAIAKVQMKKLNRMLDLRKQNARFLSEILSTCDLNSSGAVMPHEPETKTYNWYLYTLSFKNRSRDAIKDDFIRNGIGATVYYNPPVHNTPFYKNMSHNGGLVNTEWAAEHVLSLPVHPMIVEKEREQMATAIKSTLGARI